MGVFTARVGETYSKGGLVGIWAGVLGRSCWIPTGDLLGWGGVVGAVFRGTNEVSEQKAESFRPNSGARRSGMRSWDNVRVGY